MMNQCQNPVAQDNQISVKYCILPGNSSANNATKLHEPLYVNGTEVIYYCTNPSYRIKGFSRAVCNGSNGKWTNSAPTCEPDMLNRLSIQLEIETTHILWIGGLILSVLVLNALLCIYNVILSRRSSCRYKTLKFTSKANNRCTQTDQNVGRLNNDDFYEEITAYEEIETYRLNEELKMYSSKHSNYEEINDQKDQSASKENGSDSKKDTITMETELVPLRKSDQPEHKYAIVNKTKKN